MSPAPHPAAARGGTLLVLLALAGLVGCSSRRAAAYDPNAVTLCIENSAPGYGNVVAYAGSVRFTVYPGEEVCKDLRGAGSALSVRAGTTSGGAMGPLRFSFQLPTSSDCWHWRVGAGTALDIVPCG